MAIEALEAPQIIEDAGPQRWKWTGEELQRAADAGVFPPDVRLELLNGEIYRIMAPKPPHAALVGWIAELLAEYCSPGEYTVREEKPLRLNDFSDPQPDVAVVRGRKLDYVKRFPTPSDVLLIVEVSESSVAFDRGDKQRAYAAAGIPEYWIVNLRESQVEVFRQPSGEAYASAQTYKTGEAMSVPLKPGATLPVAALLGETTEAQ